MVMNKLNNKGYMLVEIVLASAIAFGVAYYMFDLIIKLKNKNDDMLVETLTMTDQTIIINKITEYINDNELLNSPSSICNGAGVNKLTVDTNTKKVILNNKTIDIVNKYADIGSPSCYNDVSNKTIEINIPLNVKQINKDFDIHLSYKY